MRASSSSYDLLFRLKLILIRSDKWQLSIEKTSITKINSGIKSCNTKRNKNILDDAITIVEQYNILCANAYIIMCNYTLRMQFSNMICTYIIMNECENGFSFILIYPIT